MKNQSFHRNQQHQLKRKSPNHNEKYLENVNLINIFFLINEFSLLGLSSSSSESNLTPENDDSQSRESISVPNEDISSSETKTINKIPVDQPTPEEEEGEIKDDDEVGERENTSNQTDTEPPPPPPPPSSIIQPQSTPSIKKIRNKDIVKQNKKPGPTKKRKIEQVKSEPIQEQDDIDNSTLAKRKKR